MSATTSQPSANPRGEILVSEQAIAAVVRGALGEVPGLYGVAPLGQEGRGWPKLAREQAEVQIVNEADGALYVKLRLVVEYGRKLHEVARETIRIVRERVRELAGVEIVRFEVEIKGLHHPVAR